MTDKRHLRYQVLKDGLPVCACPTYEIATAYYLQFDCDEIRELDEEDQGRLDED